MRLLKPSEIQMGEEVLSFLTRDINVGGTSHLLAHMAPYLISLSYLIRQCLKANTSKSTATI